MKVGYSIKVSAIGKMGARQIVLDTISLMKESLSLEYLGNCTEDDVVDDIFGSVSEFARMVEELGDDFTLGNLVVRYDDDEDIHHFYKNNG